LIAASIVLNKHNERDALSNQIEKAHGLTLPPTARNLQIIYGDGFFWHRLFNLDRGVLSLFELDEKDVPQLIDQLNLVSRSAPVSPGFGDPCVNGWNVWAVNSPTFVPGNNGYSHIRKTWSGNAEPIEMLSCNSPKGASWLHLEMWRVDGHYLIKMYSDWN
jgi:hypothetical protein